MAEEELLRVPITMELTYNYAAGRYFSKFLTSLKKGRKIIGVKCPKCKRVYLPPRPICGNCFEKMDEWVEISDKGTVRAYTVVFQPFIDGRTGKPRPAPYGIALIQLDGADTTINHYLEESDLKKLRIGMRVQAVWRDELQGDMSDILYFRIIDEVKA